MARSALMGCVFAPPKAGKTLGVLTGTLDSVPFTFLTGPDCMSRYGFTSEAVNDKAQLLDPNVLPLWTLPYINLSTIVKDWAPKSPDASPMGVMLTLMEKLAETGRYANVIDDLSIFLYQMEQWHGDPAIHGQNAAEGWGAWKRLKHDLLAFRNKAFGLGASEVWITAHVAEPTIKTNPKGERKIKMGGPHVPGYDVSAIFSGLFTTVLQIVPVEDKAGWPYEFTSHPDPEWTRGDRLNGPASGRWNLAAFKRAAGVTTNYGRYPFFEDAFHEAHTVLKDAGFPEKPADVKALTELMRRCRAVLPADAPEKAVLFPYDEAVAYMLMAPSLGPLEQMLVDQSTLFANLEA